MLLPLLVLGDVAPAAEDRWYGPATATFRVQFPGNPDDPTENDVRVVFIHSDGSRHERVAFFDGEGAYKAILVAKKSGMFRAQLTRNGVTSNVPNDEGLLEVTKPLERGFIRLRGSRFRWSDGTTYYPLGINMGWQSGDGVRPMTEQIAKLGENGVNWNRIWACHWDGKNPFWVKPSEGDLNYEVFQKWDALVQASETANVPFQFVLFHHGPWSVRVNSNWGENPWNKANGGFLEKAADFFTDPEAKRRVKVYLRSVVARYGHSPAIMAWELFNEVEWVDARYDGRWKDITAWHNEMADFIRSIDPYGHLVTTSSELEHPELYERMDFLQPHTYPANLTAAIAGSRMLPNKLGFFGEFGPANFESDPDPAASIREGVWAGVLGGHLGAAMYWPWDIVDRKDLYGTFRVLRQTLDAAGIADAVEARSTPVVMSTPTRGPLVVRPGLGWATSTTTEITVPASNDQIGGLSSYFQSETGNNRAMAKPLRIRFNARSAGEVTIRFAEVSQAGAEIVVDQNGATTSLLRLAAGEKLSTDPVRITFPAGAVDFTLRGVGPDWVRIAEITIPDSAPTLQGLALASQNQVVVRVWGTETTGAEIFGLPLSNGPVSAILVDQITGERTERAGEVVNGRFALPERIRDTVVILRRGSE